ncbi:tyrosine decarboxylase MnfA [Archaeoglobus sulfaticallidus PM70-1]|uniref:Probable L-aspartate decarboxylase n=1 Tax=Archaeoglobus sulfaticallidus PM70-1 TaxID=387631 RepID=N0BK04_9EURY|nr:tyrosine decarboxylase MfnA [Archaeoglobus sulfaticallidus]AGK60831.1 tyrosine decarboxylase MnfA [Archaeoglobus sulfaticallidus PM70-1]
MNSQNNLEYSKYSEHAETSETIRILKEFRSQDIPYNRVLSSMCTTPHPLALKAHEMFIETNLGDPGIFQGTKKLEEKLIGMIGELLHGSEVAGYICSGGTEANIQGIRAGRNKMRDKIKDSRNPNIVIPKSAHFSFEKIGDILGVEVRRAKLDEEYKVDVSEVEKLMDENTVCLVGIAGTTELGQIDPIVELSKLAEENCVELHVDAAFGGLVIPFMNNPYPFDFQNDGVSSITIDPHKMGMATIPSGGILFRNESYLRALEVETPYLTSRTQFTLTGTRPGTGVASAFAVLHGLGFDGMKKIVMECLKNTRLLTEEMISLGFEPVIDPIMNVVSFKTEKAEKIRNELMKRRWIISSIKEPRAIRFVIMPHVTEEVIKEFLSEFRKIINWV